MPADFETRVLLRGEQTGGDISVIENTVSGKWGGPPLHTHEFDETFYVLGGELTFQLEETLTSAAGGEIVFAPGGVAHALANHGDSESAFRQGHKGTAEKRWSSGPLRFIAWRQEPFPAYPCAEDRRDSRPSTSSALP